MNQNILQQIAQVDEKLTILRESWMDSKPEKKWKWMAKIDAALDERSKLMKIRDGQLVSAERRCAGTRRERHSDHSQTSVTTMKNQTHTGAALPQPRLVRPLEVGCVVTTNGGKKHTIAEIGFGGSEGVAEHPFYHWDKDWPYEIEHAAMNPETDAIVSVSWPNAVAQTREKGQANE